MILKYNLKCVRKRDLATLQPFCRLPREPIFLASITLTELNLNFAAPSYINHSFGKTQAYAAKGK